MKLSEKLKCDNMNDLAGQAERLEQEVEKLKGQYEEALKKAEELEMELDDARAALACAWDS